LEYLYCTEDGDAFVVDLPAFQPVAEVTLADGRIARRRHTAPRVVHKGSGWGDRADGDPFVNFQRTYLDDDSGKVGPNGEKY
jgi:hypothetical protein